MMFFSALYIISKKIGVDTKHFVIMKNLYYHQYAKIRTKAKHQAA